MINTPPTGADLGGTANSPDSPNVIAATRTRRLAPGLAVVAFSLLAGALAGAASATALMNATALSSLAADAAATGSSAATMSANSAATVTYAADTTEASVSAVAAEAADAVVSLEVEGRSSFRGQAASGSGSGFLVSEDGIIVTAYHVIEDATAISVVLTDGTVTSAAIVATDPGNDVAILDAPGDGYRTLALASDEVTVGETVIAIGNALGEYQTTVTAGVVSGTGRSVEVGSGRSTLALNGLIQTDAALASGMSGGPILNVAGEVVGISTADAGNAEGIAFAQPVNVAADLLAASGGGSAQ